MKRIFHTWDRWQCYPAGFYEDNPPKGMTNEQAELAYAAFLRDGGQFAAALERVLTEWVQSCEHYLTNEKMNRIAWLGQSGACIALGLPACFRGGFNRLSPDDQHFANTIALAYLNRWLNAHGERSLTLAEAQSKTIANIY